MCTGAFTLRMPELEHNLWNLRGGDHVVRADRLENALWISVNHDEDAYAMAPIPSDTLTTFTVRWSNTSLTLTHTHDTEPLHIAVRVRTGVYTNTQC